MGRVISQRPDHEESQAITAGKRRPVGLVIAAFAIIVQVAGGAARRRVGTAFVVVSAIR
jgi:hypothetical protein